MAGVKRNKYGVGGRLKKVMKRHHLKHLDTDRRLTGNLQVRLV